MYDKVTYKNDGTSLLNIGPATLKHRACRLGEGGDLILGELDYKEGLFLVTCYPLYNNSAHEYDNDAGKIHKSSNPRGR